MDVNSRRNQILEHIAQADSPISATALASKLGVSRQVIVGDVALLRAHGHEIIATYRGYVINRRHNESGFVGKITSQHASDDTKSELYEIVDLGGTILNVMLEHELYGNITGSLNIATRKDVDDFIDRLASSQDKLLMELSDDGVHSHMIACRDKGHFESIVRALGARQLLYEE